MLADAFPSEDTASERGSLASRTTSRCRRRTNYLRRIRTITEN